MTGTETHRGNDPMGAPATHVGLKESCSAPECGGETSDTGHVDVKCTDPECYGCNFCAGGLWACAVCGGFEGSMPSTCPGARMDEFAASAVYAGLRDFRDGAWVEFAVSRFAPMSVAQKQAEQS